MANRYWVGGTASWDGTAGTKWSATSGGAGGASVPTTADDVFFDAASGAATVTVAAGNTGAKTITCTGFTGTLNVNASITIAGSLTLVSGMTFSQATGAVKITISATGTITSAGKTFHGVTIDASGGTVQLGDAINCGASGTLTVTNGTFTTNGFSVTALTFDSANSNTRTINLGASTVTLSATGPGGVAWNTGAATGLTLNAGTSTINFTSGTAIFSSQGLTYNNVTFSSTSATSLLISGSTIALPINISGTLTLTAPSASGITKVSINGAPMTIGTMVASGASAVRRIMLLTNTSGTASLTITTWSTISDVDFQDISLNTSRSGTRLGDCGGNTNVTFSAAKTVYWNLAGAQNWSATGWATSSGGAPAANNFPLAQDTAVFDNTGSVTGTITINADWNIGTLDMSARSSSMTLSSSTNAPFIYGDWVNGSGTTLSGTGTITFAGRKAQSITSAGKSFTQSIALMAPAYTTSLQDALSTPSFSLGNGTLNLNGQTLTCTTTFVTLSGTKNLTFNGGSVVCSASATDAFNNINATGFTTTSGTGSGTISMTGATAKTFVGGGSTYNCTLNQGGAGALTVDGVNTFSNMSNTYSGTGATTITFAANQTIADFTATGAVGKVLTINSSVAGTRRTLTKTGGGVVSVDYLSVRDSGAAGVGATWYAGANSTNVSNNTGWLFSAGPSASGGSMMMAFFPT